MGNTGSQTARQSTVRSLDPRKADLVRDVYLQESYGEELTSGFKPPLRVKASKVLPERLSRNSQKSSSRRRSSSKNETRIVKRRNSLTIHQPTATSARRGQSLPRNLRFYFTPAPEDDVLSLLSPSHPHSPTKSSYHLGDLVRSTEDLEPPAAHRRLGVLRFDANKPVPLVRGDLASPLTWPDVELNCRLVPGLTKERLQNGEEGLKNGLVGEKDNTTMVRLKGGQFEEEVLPLKLALGGTDSVQLFGPKAADFLARKRGCNVLTADHSFALQFQAQVRELVDIPTVLSCYQMITCLQVSLRGSLGYSLENQDTEVDADLTHTAANRSRGRRSARGSVSKICVITDCKKSFLTRLAQPLFELTGFDVRNEESPGHSEVVFLDLSEIESYQAMSGRNNRRIAKQVVKQCLHLMREHMATVGGVETEEERHPDAKGSRPKVRIGVGRTSSRSKSESVVTEHESNEGKKLVRKSSSKSVFSDMSQDSEVSASDPGGAVSSFAEKGSRSSASAMHTSQAISDSKPSLLNTAVPTTSGSRSTRRSFLPRKEGQNTGQKPVLRKRRAERSQIRAFLVGPTDLGPITDCIRYATGLPVYDSLTLMKFMLGGFGESTRYGIKGWQAAYKLPGRVLGSEAGRSLAAFSQCTAILRELQLRRQEEARLAGEEERIVGDEEAINGGKDLNLEDSNAERDINPTIRDSSRDQISKLLSVHIANPKAPTTEEKTSSPSASGEKLQQSDSPSSGGNNRDTNPPENNVSDSAEPPIVMNRHTGQVMFLPDSGVPLPEGYEEGITEDFLLEMLLEKVRLLEGEKVLEPNSSFKTGESSADMEDSCNANPRPVTPQVSKSFAQKSPDGSSCRTNDLDSKSLLSGHDNAFVSSVVRKVQTRTQGSRSGSEATSLSAGAHSFTAQSPVNASLIARTRSHSVVGETEQTQEALTFGPSRTQLEIEAQQQEDFGPEVQLELVPAAQTSIISNSDVAPFHDVSSFEEVEHNNFNSSDYFRVEFDPSRQDHNLVIAEEALGREYEKLYFASGSTVPALEATQVQNLLSKAEKEAPIASLEDIAEDAVQVYSADVTNESGKIGGDISASKDTQPCGLTQTLPSPELGSPGTPEALGAAGGKTLVQQVVEAVVTQNVTHAALEEGFEPVWVAKDENLWTPVVNSADGENPPLLGASSKLGAASYETASEEHNVLHSPAFHSSENVQGLSLPMRRSLTGSFPLNPVLLMGQDCEKTPSLTSPVAASQVVDRNYEGDASGEPQLQVRHLREAVKLGVIRLDYYYPPMPGDIDHPDSFPFDVYYTAVPGLTFEMCQANSLTKEVEKNFVEGIR